MKIRWLNIRDILPRTPGLGMLMFAQLDPGEVHHRVLTRPPTAINYPSGGWEPSERMRWVNSHHYPRPPAVCQRCGIPRPNSHGFCSELCENAAWCEERDRQAAAYAAHRREVHAFRQARVRARAEAMEARQSKTVTR